MFIILYHEVNMFQLHLKERLKQYAMQVIRKWCINEHARAPTEICSSIV